MAGQGCSPRSSPLPPGVCGWVGRGTCHVQVPACVRVVIRNHCVAACPPHSGWSHRTLLF